MNKKGKLKEFWEEHKNQIIVTAIGVTGLGAISMAYVKGYWQGAMVSYEATINSFDKKFPAIELKKLIEEDIKEHPENYVTLRYRKKV